ncbi:hypothetical protein PR202_ga03592 [Eleusine coracana subsp. coracana]|uniref:Uncharacterized protein n=1 Tax=Eleusine coracana subsp. coracana TaxID=191504 RepID=A0AAV5BPI6_ELECO|nr:hypothetical protein PR202_ga03592 [Eleusine coracana subsp. coracana]
MGAPRSMTQGGGGDRGGSSRPGDRRLMARRAAGERCPMAAERGGRRRGGVRGCGGAAAGSGGDSWAKVRGSGGRRRRRGEADEGARARLLTAVGKGASQIGNSEKPKMANGAIHRRVHGWKGNNLPSPSQVVQLYRSKGIKGMRIDDPDKGALDAVRNSGIVALVLDTANGVLAELASNPSIAASWVQANVRPYYPDVNIKYIAVGNEVEGGAMQSILPAMRNINNALADAGLGSIKVSTSIKFNVIADSYPPSAGRFAQPYMVEIARFLASTGAPLLANVYPYFAYRDGKGRINLNYATFQPGGGGGATVRDDHNGLVYTNLLDAMVDAIHAALEKAGAPSVRIVVLESGWPSAGRSGASMDNARNYNQGLINHVGQGTPKNGQALETCVCAMFNENQKPDDITEKHFGLFYPNMSPVYPIRFA